ncbi:hypothetical protein [Bifidobacterium pseudolongum]|uniref:hypothetical protein n=1 Tax=Bifidobacterium pseudolongum TaxID=1694 RepID=UPI0013EDD63E|nr:hypothetical protein [Bifidobacterium pseudolongum]
MAHEQIHGGIVRAGTPGVSLQVILGFLAIGLPEALLGASWPAMGAGYTRRSWLWSASPRSSPQAPPRRR